MAITAIVGKSRWTLLPLGLFLATLVSSVFFLSAAAQDSVLFARWYLLLFVINALCILTLLALIGVSLYRLVKQYRNQELGSRLTSRLVLIFILLATVPAAFVYYFSLSFLQRGVDSWFDTRIEQALNDALALGRSAFEYRMREHERSSEMLAQRLQQAHVDNWPLVLAASRIDMDASDLTIFDRHGLAMASSSVDEMTVLPQVPGEEILMQLRQGQNFVGLEPGKEGLFIRALVPLPKSEKFGQTAILQASFPLSGRISGLATRVEDAYAGYKGLLFLRRPLTGSFVVTLSLALLQSILMAAWAAFYFARRITDPIRVLGLGTRAVAAGNYTQQLPKQSDDEVGALVESFNDMTLRIAAAQDEVRANQQTAEQQKIYFETVLGQLSSGIITLTHDWRLHTSNKAAGKILDLDFAPHLGLPMQALAEEHTGLQPLLQLATEEFAKRQQAWQAQLTLRLRDRQRILMCRGSRLPPSGSSAGGHVLVIDDITQMVQAQKNAAWGDAARRLAHEIKNPLTPIQLSAERLRHKYLEILPADESKLLDRATQTIIQHVASMKDMVKAFTTYAAAPAPRFSNIALDEIIDQVTQLYEESADVQLSIHCPRELPLLNADAGRLRQLLHNLIRNAREATHGEVEIRINAGLEGGGVNRRLRLQVCDNGPGVDAGLREQIFEPYFTTKTKGSGLGLAIARKIAEEHNATLQLLPSERGACFGVDFPLERLVFNRQKSNNALPTMSSPQESRRR